MPSNRNRRNVIRHIGIKYGCVSLIKEAEELLESFLKKKNVDRQGNEVQPVLGCVAIFVVASSSKVGLPRREIVREACATNAQFVKVRFAVHKITCLTSNKTLDLFLSEFPKYATAFANLKGNCRKRKRETKGEDSVSKEDEGFDEIPKAEQDLLMEILKRVPQGDD